jgi:pyruvate formate lyase activating enzyme
MKFTGWQKVSLVDYPGLISTLLFVKKCNFWCEYCHNKDLQNVNTYIGETEIFEFLNKKGKKLDALCITGGEPSIYKDELFDFIKRVKEKFPYLKVKTDTNGSNPSYITEGKKYFDYVAMDFKSLDYSTFSNISMNTIFESLEALKEYENYEVRITVYPPYIKPKDFKEIAKILKGMKSVFIQQYRPVNDVRAYDTKVLEEFCSYFENCSIRQ